MLGDKNLKGTKLPKLSIQQQIDNQQVIERMNRKMGFTKNPRHPSTQTRLAIGLSLASSLKTSLVADPPFLSFTDFYPCHTYQSSLSLLNHTPHIQRCKIVPFKKPCFLITEVRYPRQDTGDIAPGMSVQIVVRFRPTSLDDCEDQLTVILQEGVIKLPVTARREKCSIEWPVSVECGHCWVGSTIHKHITLLNKGGEAVFRLRQEKGGGVFDVQPSQLAFRKNIAEDIRIMFSPDKEGNHQHSLVYVSEQGEEKKIQIKGGAYRAQVIVDKMNGERVMESGVNHIMYLKESELDQDTINTIELKNLAVVQVQYFWQIVSEDESVSASISDIRGKLSPSQLRLFTLSLKNSNRYPLPLRAQLYLFNLPQKSLVNNSITKVINGVPSILCLTIHLDIKVLPSSWSVLPLYLQITQPLYQNISIPQHITIRNESPIPRTFHIKQIKDSSLLKIHCEREVCSIAGKSSMEIRMQCRMVELSRSMQRVRFIVQCVDNGSQMITIGGCVTYPDIVVERSIYYGLMRVNSIERVVLPIVNEQDGPVRVRVDNKHRYREMEYYDMYEFEDEREKHRLFMVSTDRHMGQAIDWVTVPPHTKTQFTCAYFTQGEQSVSLNITIEVENGHKYDVDVVGEVYDVCLMLSREEINLREIYKGNIYNSNKFLNKELSLRNIKQLQTGYEMRVRDEGQCLVKVSPKSGVLQRGVDQRIDLIIEPIRTGQFQIIVEWRCFDPYQVKHLIGDREYEWREEGKDITIEYSQRKLLRSVYRYGELKIRGCVKGLQINYYLKDESKVKRVRQKVEEAPQSVKASSFKSSRNQMDKLVYPNLQLVAFYNCEINSVRQVEILLQNDSGLTAQFRVYAEKYESEVKTEEQDGGVRLVTKSSVKAPTNTIQSKKMIQTIASKSIMSKTMQANAGRLIMRQETAFHSPMGEAYMEQKQLKESQKAQLASNKGIAIRCEPRLGILHKKQVQKIVITVFNDCSGQFKDSLVIDVKDHEVKRFPIDINVVGTPVVLSRNQLGIDFSQAVPLMQLGGMLPLNGPSHKQLKVSNNGSNPISLHWTVYPCPTRDQHTNVFNISLVESPPGSTDIIRVQYEAIHPRIQKDSLFSIQPQHIVLKGKEETTFTINIKEFNHLGLMQSLFVCEPRMIEGDSRLEVLAVKIEGEAVSPYLTIDSKVGSMLYLGSVSNTIEICSLAYRGTDQLKQLQEEDSNEE